MANGTNDAETGGRRSRIRTDELPQADPIAYLGTERHPISVPPTTHDIEPVAESMRGGAETATKSHVSRRVLATAIGFAIVIPMAVSLSTSDDVARAPATGTAARAAAPPREPVQAVPADLPPGGVTESTVPEAEPPMTADRAVADWTSTPQNPATDATDVSRMGKAAATVRSVSAGPALAAEAHAVPVRVAVPRPATHRSVGAFATPFDFTAAMNAVAARNVGPAQCGLEAVGATPVAITFAPNGHATRAVVENGPLRGTAAGSCVALRLRDTQIAPFDGDAATIRTNVMLR
ncbi:MAG TPA: hypothetical protein VH062_18285 [Polyangiaceae bacterium]|jgi:hypothetical protein|nr:hypothetical protein [Polyangiaceae bacterium]